jgi:DNA-binding response OmpR family regulator
MRPERTERHEGGRRAMSGVRDATVGLQVVALENDLFFVVKIRDTLKQAGFQARLTRSVAEFRERLAEGGYAVALVNTAARGVDWRSGIAAAREIGVPVIAYGPHVDLDTQAAARAAGAARVIANSRLAELPAIIERVIARTSGQATSVADGAGDAEPSHLDSGERSGEQPDE